MERLFGAVRQLPLVAEWVSHSSGSPSVLVMHGGDLDCSGIDRPLEGRVSVGNGDDHPYCETGVDVWGELFVAFDPERGSVELQFGHLQYAVEFG